MNWKKHSKYRHLKVVFHDKVYNLAKKKGHKFKHLTKSAHLFANQVDLESHVGLRKSGTHLTLWKKTNDSIGFRLDSALDLFVSFDAENAKHLNEIKLDSRKHTAFETTQHSSPRQATLTLHLLLC